MGQNLKNIFLIIIIWRFKKWWYGKFSKRFFWYLHKHFLQHDFCNKTFSKKYRMGREWTESVGLLMHSKRRQSFTLDNLQISRMHSLTKTSIFCCLVLISLLLKWSVIAMIDNYGKNIRMDATQQFISVFAPHQKKNTKLPIRRMHRHFFSFFPWKSY